MVQLLPFIVSYLGRARITRGTYMDLEEYALDRCPTPDLSKLTQSDNDAIEELWQKISKTEVPSLLEQLRDNHPFRRELDDGILNILGISNPQERDRLATTFQKGAYTAIRTLNLTMDGDDETTDEGY